MDPALFQAVLQQGSEHFTIIPKMDRVFVVKH
jgi:hypothetical protein